MRDDWPWIIKARYGKETYEVHVDPCMWIWAKRYSWFMNTDGYVFRNRTLWHRGWKKRTKTYRQYLHREIMGLRRRHKRVVHHDDGNPLNCRANNMTVMTAARNARLAQSIRGYRPLWAKKVLRA